MNLSTEKTANIEAEQTVLGAILLDSTVLDRVSNLEERDFANARHRQLFKVMRYLDQMEKPVDLVTVTTEYNRFGKVDEMGGVDYLASLADSVPTTSNIEHYAKMVRSAALRRRGIEVGNEIASLSEGDFPTDEDYFSAIESKVDELRPKDDGKMKSLKDIGPSYFTHLKQPVSTVKTGFSKFDTWSNGLARGALIISAGRPSVGKTAMLLQRVLGISNRPTAGAQAIWSQEMKNTELIDRMIANITDINYPKIIKRNLSEFDHELIQSAYKELERKPIFINDSSGVSIQEVRSKARELKRRYGKLDLIAVDYLQIMNIPKEKNETRAEAIGKVTRTAKQIAREMDCPFIMLSQMTRESEQKKKPQLSDLKESSSIEQDADIVEFLWWDQQDTDNRGKVIQQLIAKGRSIGINEFRLLFRGWKQKFEELPDKP